MSSVSSILRPLTMASTLLLMSSPAWAQVDLEIYSFVGDSISSAAPVVFGEDVRVDFMFVSDGSPAVGAYNVLLRWDHDRLRFKGMEFGDGLGFADMGESSASVLEIGETPFDHFWWATFEQASFLGEQELSDRQPSIFRGATAVFEVIDPTLTVLGGNMGFGKSDHLDNYVRDANGSTISFRACAVCPLPQAPEFHSGGMFPGTILATVGQPIQFTVTASDADSSALYLRASGTPAGAFHAPYPPPRSNPVTTTFHWVPLRPGVARIEYRVGDLDPITEDDIQTVLILVGLDPAPQHIRSGPLGPPLPYPLAAPFSWAPGPLGSDGLRSAMRHVLEGRLMPRLIEPERGHMDIHWSGRSVD